MQANRSRTRPWGGVLSVSLMASREPWFANGGWVPGREFGIRFIAHP